MRRLETKRVQQKKPLMCPIRKNKDGFMEVLLVCFVLLASLQGFVKRIKRGEILPMWGFGIKVYYLSTCLYNSAQNDES